MNMNDAYELAHELEFFETNSVRTFLSAELASSRERHIFLRKEVHRHQGKLMSFTRNFGDRAWRRQIVCQDPMEIS